MSWKPLDSMEGISNLRESSFNRPQLIFKHSTRCGISSFAMEKMDQSLPELEAHFDVHFIDLLSFRPVSFQVADTFGVRHRSPQVLMIHQGKSVYDDSHYKISPQDLLDKWAVITA